MNIIFFRYGSICEPDIIDTFSSLGVNVIEENTNFKKGITDLNGNITTIHKLITEHSPAFVFSINFYPFIAEVCHIHNTLYLSWSVDCPVIPYFAKQMQYPTNRIFLFDREQYKRLQSFNPTCVFHLPLAANIARFDYATRTITAKERRTYAADISFIGSLYSEKNPLANVKGLSPYAQGYIDSIVESSLQIYGYNFMEETIPDCIVDEFKSLTTDFYSSDSLVTNIDKYVIAHKYLGAHAAVTERIRTLNTLAEHFSVDLYTASDTSPLRNVRTHGQIESMYAMPKVFHLSKINLNTTMKAIQSGLPLRIFDILGSGGFLMTNYQEELSDHFQIGVDLEAYCSMEELVDKCAYYLEHDDERIKIALQGYEKVKKYHSHPLRITEMIRLASSNI